MGKKSEERERRRAQKQQHFEDSKPGLLEKLQAADQHPRVRNLPAVSGAPRLAPHAQRNLKNLAEISTAFARSRFAENVTWCSTKSDLEGAWSWGEARQWSEDEWEEVIHPAFQNFSSSTWGEIDKHSTEAGHKMHHAHEVSDVIKEAQDRWLELDLEQYDTLFRFRLSGRRRAWGYILQSHFHLVWWDREHSIYPVEKH